MADAYVETGSGMDLFKDSNTVMAAGIAGILLIMMIPTPSFVLDILLSFSITLSLIILLVSVYVSTPLDFSVFPSILLITTLLRLSLNVASTRLILLHGNEGTTAAGQVIKAFGAFVVGGNYVVGLIVFLVLVLINFIVITKGSTRIAEVAARFTLDAMPGKQMAIDADLNAGLITDAEARKRRDAIGQELNFYGAMDGASKFVRGDAIAGIIITLINILGGLVVGVLQQGLSLTDAAVFIKAILLSDFHRNLKKKRPCLTRVLIKIRKSNEFPPLSVRPAKGKQQRWQKGRPAVYSRKNSMWASSRWIPIESARRNN